MGLHHLQVCDSKMHVFPSNQRKLILHDEKQSKRNFVRLTSSLVNMDDSTLRDTFNNVAQDHEFRFHHKSQCANSTR
jgi:hypothetical protein